MLTKNKIRLTGIAVLFALLVSIQHFMPNPINWQLNFYGTSKSPYACSVLRDQLKVVFPGRQIETNSVSFYSRLNQNPSINQNLIVITNEFNPDNLDLLALLDFVAKGNSVFISALAFSDNFADTLNFSTNTPLFDTTFLRTGKEILKLNYVESMDDSSFIFQKKMPVHYFTSYDSLKSHPLGSDISGNENFIFIPFGAGRIFLNCQPMAFTNFHMLYGNYKYAFTALSCLPVNATIWDQYYKPIRIIDLSPLRFILSEPTLRSAYYLAMITIFISMVFGFKRKQRIIPVIQPLENTSLNFVKTVGRLYFRSQNHTDLGKKKIVYFKEFLRNRYYYYLTDYDTMQAVLLASKSGVEIELIQQIFHSISMIEYGQLLYKEGLIELHNLLESFYKKCK